MPYSALARRPVSFAEPIERPSASSTCALNHASPIGIKSYTADRILWMEFFAIVRHQTLGMYRHPLAMILQTEEPAIPVVAALESVPGNTDATGARRYSRHPHGTVSWEGTYPTFLAPRFLSLAVHRLP